MDTGTQVTRPAAEFGEQILWNVSSKRVSKKAKSSWREETFLGIGGGTGEVFVASKNGRVNSCRTIRAFHPAERWDAQRLFDMKDYVANGVYDFGRGDGSHTDEDDADTREPEPNNQEPNDADPRELADEEDVARMLMDSDDEAQIDQKAEEYGEFAGRDERESRRRD